jgi:hypothetical protein
MFNESTLSKYIEKVHHTLLEKEVDRALDEVR